MTRSIRDFKEDIYCELSRLGKCISSGPRLEMLDLLCQAPRTVETLAKLAGQSVANTSHHLQVLRRARLVVSEKQGVHVTYSVADHQVSIFFCALRDLAQARLLEIQQVAREFIESRGSFEAVDREVLVERVIAGGVAVLDVRPAEEYAAGHLPNAVSIPIQELKSRLAELPADQEIIAYCRGPYCVMAVEAVKILRAKGYAAVRLEDGVADWRARGLEVSLPAPNAHGP